MSQCQRCRKYVHSGCDPEADRTLVQRKKDANSDYEYLCPPCKVSSPVPTPKSALELDPPSESNPGSASRDDPQTSRVDPQQQQAVADVDVPGTPTYSDELQQQQQQTQQQMQLEETKPLAVRIGQKVIASQQQQSAGKIARKRMTGATAASGGRPKGSGKASSFGAAGSNSGGGAAYNRKANKLADFGRKRGPKPKMRGLFGAPGVGLQRPGEGTGGAAATTTGSVSSTGGGGVEGEPCLENKLILCSSSDSFVVEQDACAMCGSFGLDQEGRLISCAQCGQVIRI
jgi:[histone H3]-lysine4 N-trimethyltransferase MLL3